MNSRRCSCCLPSLNIVNQLLVTFTSELRLSCLVVIVRHWESLGSITDIQQQQQQQQHGLVWGGTCRLWAIGRELRGYGLQSLVYGLTGLWHASNVHAFYWPFHLRAAAVVHFPLLQKTRLLCKFRVRNAFHCSYRCVMFLLYFFVAFLQCLPTKENLKFVRRIDSIARDSYGTSASAVAQFK